MFYSELCYFALDLDTGMLIHIFHIVREYNVTILIIIAFRKSQLLERKFYTFTGNIFSTSWARERVTNGLSQINVVLM